MNKIWLIVLICEEKDVDIKFIAISTTALFVFVGITFLAMVPFYNIIKNKPGLDKLYLVPTEPLEPTDHVNHSCTPNCGFRGQVSLITMRKVEAGEELTFDYAMSDSSPYDEFICHCDSVWCRGQITGRDWQMQTLQSRYEGYFSAYLAAKIAAYQHRFSFPS